MFHPRLDSLARLARMWGAVLVSNIIGTFAFAWLISIPGVIKPELSEALLSVARNAFSPDFGVGLLRAMFAGWLIALMVWLLPSVGAAAPFIIVALTYVVALTGFPHIIAGSTEAAYAWINGAATGGDYVVKFFLPTLIGNTVGGTALAALLNHAPVAHDLAAREAD
jgi:formate/nitrite transporter FocA (FNT family)